MTTQDTTAARVGVGVGCAGVVAVPLSMGVTVIDRSVVQFANGSMPSLRVALAEGMKNLARSPLRCFMGIDNRAVYLVYGSTYCAKNASEITCRDNGWNPKWPMFFSTVIVNGGVGMWKDKFLAQLFGSQQAAAFPLRSYAMFSLRDSLLIGVSFVVAPQVAPYVGLATGLPSFAADALTQVSVPAAAQLLATPVHILGLDFYNRPDRIGVSTRMVDAIRASRGPILARMLRQGYVFGFGSLCVKYLTNAMVENKPKRFPTGRTF